LGGVQIPHSKGLDGHSDADVLLHAIIDALLGAAALPDIGTYFPPGDPATQNIPSERMLFKALAEVEAAGYRVENVDSVLIAEAPKIAVYRMEIRQTIARLLRIPVNAVQVKGKTNEGLDTIGKEQAMAAQAVVLLCKSKSIRR
jgi:2-C-methyl-D-erythritol 2,4-cyclodiphosphate synthase